MLLVISPFSNDAIGVTAPFLYHRMAKLVISPRLDQWTIKFACWPLSTVTVLWAGSKPGSSERQNIKFIIKGKYVLKFCMYTIITCRSFDSNTVNVTNRRYGVFLLIFALLKVWQML